MKLKRTVSLLVAGLHGVEQFSREFTSSQGLGYPLYHNVWDQDYISLVNALWRRHFAIKTITLGNNKDMRQIS